MHWTGLIIMDCWGGAWHDRCAKSRKFYQQILESIQPHRFQYVIEATYAVSGGLVIDPVFRDIDCAQRFTHVRTWGDFADLPGNQGAWIMAGQSWQACLHHRLLGFRSFMDSDRVRCQLYSHPKLVDHGCDTIKAVTAAEFANDPYIPWEPRSMGWWRIKESRSRGAAWL